MSDSKNVYRKTAEARFKLQQQEIKKSGFNPFAKFKYFELADFLPHVNRIFNEVGLCSRFWIEDGHDNLDEHGCVIDSENGKAFLEIINADNPEEKILFTTPVADAGMKGATPIQNLGSIHTYMRRYLWLEAMEISESDAVDATSGEGEKKPESKSEKKPEQQQAAKQKTAKTSEKQAKQSDKPQPAPNMPCTAEQIRIIGELAGPERVEKMKKYYGVTRVQDMNVAQASEAIKTLQARS